MPINLDNSFANHELALKLRSQRGEVLASNIANANTPGYKARDVDFRAILGQAITGQKTGSITATVTNEKHLPRVTSDGYETTPLFRVPTQPSMDGNTVDMPQEQAAFSDNAIRYRATLEFINQQIRSLRLAITGQG